MAIIYEFKIIDPNDVGAFPPSVLASDWFNGFRSSTNDLGVGTVFVNREALDTWLSANTLTDPSLLADIATWKSTHNISYVHTFYYTFSDIPTDGRDPTPFVSE